LVHPELVHPIVRKAEEKFNGRMRDELLNGEIFHSLLEAQLIIERWREGDPPICGAVGN